MTVSGSPGEIVDNINFTAVPKIAESTQNSFLRIVVNEESDWQSESNCAIGTTGGLPTTTADDNKALLFGFPNPLTSFTTVLVDRWIIFGNEREGWFSRHPTVSPDGKTITRSWTTFSPKIEFIQKVSLVKSTWSLYQYEDTAELRYLIVNQDQSPHSVGLRIMLDTMLGDDDGVPILIPNTPRSDGEREFRKGVGRGIPPWWTAVKFDNSGKVVFSAQGTLDMGEATPPDRFAAVRWQNIYNRWNPWNYTIDPNLDITYDSAVAMWWEPRYIAPGDTLKIVTYYGLGEAVPDTVPPYVGDWNPYPDALELRTPSSFSFTIKDDFRGVDKSTVKVSVNGEPLPEANLRFEGDIRSYRVVCRPVKPFRYGQTIDVAVDAQDLAWQPNVMPTQRCRFSIVSDTVPPYVADHNPAPDSREVALNAPIVFNLKDDLAGVDRSSITILLNGKPVTPKISGDSLNYAVQIDHPPFAWNDTIRVQVSAADLAFPPNAMSPQSWSFAVVNDHEPPFLSDFNPQPNSKEVAVNQPILFNIRDVKAGVDRSSINILLNGKPVTPKISGDSSNYAVQIDHPPFAWNDTVHVQVSAADLASPPNLMAPQRFGFRTERGLPDLRIEELKTDSDKFLVGEPVGLSCRIVNDYADVPAGVLLRISADGKTALDTTLAALPAGTYLTLSLRLPPFQQAGDHRITAAIDPQGAVQERSKTNNSAETTVRIAAAELSIHPNPFTPNGDGFNDAVRFEFRGLNYKTPEVVIFNIKGAELVRLYAPDRQEIIWDGRDRDGKLQKPGVYIYMFRESGKIIAKGTIALAL